MNYEHKHKVLVDYLQSKVDESDWHGVCNVANDLRVMEAERAVHVERDAFDALKIRTDSQQAALDRVSAASAVSSGAQYQNTGGEKKLIDPASNGFHTVPCYCGRCQGKQTHDVGLEGAAYRHVPPVREPIV